MLCVSVFYHSHKNENRAPAINSVTHLGRAVIALSGQFLSYHDNRRHNVHTPTLLGLEAVDLLLILIAISFFCFCMVI